MTRGTLGAASILLAALVLPGCSSPPAAATQPNRLDVEITDGAGVARARFATRDFASAQTSQTQDGAPAALLRLTPEAAAQLQAATNADDRPRVKVRWDGVLVLDAVVQGQLQQAILVWAAEPGAPSDLVPEVIRLVETGAPATGRG